MNEEQEQWIKLKNDEKKWVESYAKSYAVEVLKGVSIYITGEEYDSEFGGILNHIDQKIKELEAPND